MNPRAWWIGAAIGLVGCSQTPLPTLSSSDVPAAFEQPVAPNAPIWPAGGWWQGYGDAQLSKLVGEAQANNLDLAQAEARLRQADARARQAGAALLPTIGLGGNIDTFYGQANGTPAHETDYGAGLGASYELDFWGKNRALADAADAARTASAADRQTVALTITAGVTNTYFQLLSLRERIAVAQASLQSSQVTLNLVERRVRAGSAAAADATQERANMAAQRAILPTLQQQELETRDALAILLGRPPEGFVVAGANLNGISAPSIAPGLPSALLGRRPDIATAEANLAAAHANLVAARAAFLPDITLNANAGLQYPALAAAVQTLPGVGFGAGAAASLVQIIFDGGRRTAVTDEAKAHEEELLAAYRAAVVNAFSDVENALGNLNHLTAQQEALQDQVMQAEMVLSAARRKYDSGNSDFLVVTTAERSLYAARDQLSDVRRAQLSASVALYKALGGGYTSGDKALEH
ncbi:MAG: efflux transporter outer membrane subunit [Alphaproteobacteria bacterium]|nr:efflux transporter outer membrane subunit [Alphaproteobacteria bacterium]